MVRDPSIVSPSLTGVLIGERAWLSSVHPYRVGVQSEPDSYLPDCSSPSYIHTYRRHFCSMPCAERRFKAALVSRDHGDSAYVAKPGEAQHAGPACSPARPTAAALACRQTLQQSRRCARRARRRRKRRCGKGCGSQSPHSKLTQCRVCAVTHTHTQQQTPATKTSTKPSAAAT